VTGKILKLYARKTADFEAKVANILLQYNTNYQPTHLGSEICGLLLARYLLDATLKFRGYFCQTWSMTT
jgi:hypothetical protein